MNMKFQKEVILSQIVSGIKEGKKPIDIAKKNSISPSKLSYYLKKLRAKGIIEKKGYGVWILRKGSSNLTKDTFNVRGHAFMWKIKLPRKIDFIKILEKKKITYKKIYKGTPRITFKNRKIWLGKKNIIIYDLKSYFGHNSVETKKYAFMELLAILDALQAKLDISLQRDELYTITVAKQHYSLVKNNLAIQCRKDGTKIDIRDKDGQWFIIDNSYNLDEAETVHKETALIDNMGVQKYFNEHKETKFQVTPKFLLETIGGLAKSQQTMVNTMNDYAKHIKSHTKSIVALSKAVPKLTKLLKETKQENTMLKQRKLSDWS